MCPKNDVFAQYYRRFKFKIIVIISLKAIICFTSPHLYSKTDFKFNKKSAVALFTSGNIAEAFLYTEESLKDFKKNVKLIDTNTYLNTLESFYWFYHDLGKQSFFIKFLENELTESNKIDSCFNIYKRTIYNFLGNLYNDIGNYNKSEKLLLDLLKKQQDNNSTINKIATTYNNLSVLYMNTNSLDKAERYQNENNKIRRKLSNDTILYTVIN
jgi:tetratricopeptide (TPR) repeat protein